MSVLQEKIEQQKVEDIRKIQEQIQGGVYYKGGQNRGKRRVLHYDEEIQGWQNQCSQHSIFQ